MLIGFDSRHHSQEFAREASCVLAGNGIRVYLLEELRPTPYISFACRYKKAHAAIMITASHNPKEYNGYKVYWSDGAQVVAPHDEGIIKEADALKDLSSVKRSTVKDPLIESVQRHWTPGTWKRSLHCRRFPEENRKSGAQLRSSTRACMERGLSIVPQALKAWGFT